MKHWTLVCLILISVLVFGAQSTFAGGCDPQRRNCDVDIGFRIEVSYPRAVMEHDFAARIIYDFVGNYVTNIMDGIIGIPVRPETIPAVPFSLSITAEEYWFDNTTVSVVFSVVDYLGGPHGNLGYRTYTFDLNNERAIGFSDLFQPDVDPLAVIAPIVQQDLQTQLGEFANADWIARGAGPDLDNYANFAISDTHLIVFFHPYQVSAYVAGPRRVEIPLELLGEILAKPFNSQESVTG